MGMNNLSLSSTPATDAPTAPATPAPLSADEQADYDALVSVGIANPNGRTKTRLMLAGLLPNDGTARPKTSNAPPLAVDNFARARGVRYLLAIASGVSPSVAMRSLGVDWADLQRLRWADVRFSAAWDAASAMRTEYLAHKADAALADLLDADNASRASVRAVLFTLERLRRDSFGDPRTASSSASGASSGGGITYNINISASAPPSSASVADLCGHCVGGTADAPIIDTSAI